jgi:aspartate/methionine/tyrosine aminotransferase
MRRDGIDVLDFSAGRADEHTPRYIVDGAVAAMMSGDTHQTAAQGTVEFLTACGNKLSRENGLTKDPDTQIIATLGCKEGLLLALMATLDPGDEIIIEDPCFVSYGPAISFCGAVPVAVPLLKDDRFRWTEACLERTVTSRTRAILLCSPHNPTGTVHSKNDLAVIAAIAIRHDLLVIVDETYERLAWDGLSHHSLAALPGMADRTVGLMGVTKAFSMGGWRVGFAYGPQAVIRSMVVLQQHLVTCAGSFSQAGAAIAIGSDPTDEVVSLWADWEKRCRFVTSGVGNIGSLTCSMPEGGFYAWIDISSTERPSIDVSNWLLNEHGLVLVPGTAFGPTGEGYLRMTCVKNWETLNDGLDRLTKAFST